MWLTPQGHATLVDPDLGTVVRDTMTCGHCNRLTHIKPKMRPEDMGGLCKVCMRLICSHCVGAACDVIEQKLERWEASQAARRSYGI